MRVHDPIGGPPDLARYFAAYDRYFAQLPGYKHALRRLTAGYSRGDSAAELRPAFETVVRKAAAENDTLEHEPAAERVFGHQGRFPELLRDALVVLSFALCLRAPAREVRAILACCDRGDPILEAVADAALDGAAQAAGPPTFPAVFDGIYDALSCPPNGRPGCVKRYLDAWYTERMEGFTFKGDHLIPGQREYVGYWCFEAAGVVAAFGIDDGSFARHPHYPADLVAIYRGAGH